MSVFWMKDLLVIDELISCLWIFKHLKNSIYSLVKLGFKGRGFLFCLLYFDYNISKSIGLVFYS